jgi:hypothetical protein
VLDAGDQVALGGDDLLRPAPVPGQPVVEDVPEPVPLRGALSGMATTSSAPPMLCGNPWLPRAASTPVSSLVCTGLVRRRQPFWGPFMSKLCVSEKRAPRRTRAAPPAWPRPGSSACRARRPPQRPQLDYAFAAAAMAPSGSWRSGPAFTTAPPRSGCAGRRAR